MNENDGVVVTLTAQRGTLEERIEILNRAFVRVVEDGHLRRILEWDVGRGRIQFMVDAQVDRRRLNGHPVRADIRPVTTNGPAA